MKNNAHLNEVEAGVALGSVSHSTKGAAVRGAVKRLIVLAACWRLLPAPAASWILQKGGLAHA